MDLFKLDKDTFFADPDGSLVEGWTSLIWTERHKDLGDFQLKTPYVDETIEKLPLGSLVSIRDSSEVCRVENLATSTNDKGATELVVAGRSLESFLEKRALTGPWNEPWEIPGSYTVQDMVMMYIWNSIVNPHDYEVIRDYHWDHLARDVIPNVIVTDSTKALKAVVGAGSAEDLQTVKEWGFDRGPLYPKVQEMLTLGNLGIRIVRPTSSAPTAGPGKHDTSGGAAKILTDVSFASDTAARTLTKTSYTTTDKLRFDIYNGRDRSVNSAANTPLDVHSAVIFDYISGHIENPQYLFSNKESFTTVHLQAPDESVEVYAGEVGLDFTMEWVSVDNIDDTLVGATYHQFMVDKAWAEWKNRKILKMIDGAITSNNPWIYGEDYYLGDLVTVQGEYDAGGTKMVSEYIRTSDETGEKAYPTLIDPP